MDVALKEMPDYTIVEVAGDLIGDTHSQFEDFLRNCLEIEKGIVIDFSKLSYISSVGFGTLARTYKDAMKRQVEVVIVEPPEDVRHVIKTVELDRLCRMFSSLNDAEDHFKQS